MADPVIPKIEVPLRFVNGRARLVEQDSQEEIEQCVESLLRTVAGERVERPDFGIPDFVHRERGVDVEEVRAAVDDAEPRAVYVAALDESDLGAMISRVEVAMKGAEGNG